MASDSLGRLIQDTSAVQRHDGEIVGQFQNPTRLSYEGYLNEIETFALTTEIVNYLAKDRFLLRIILHLHKEFFVQRAIVSVNSTLLSKKATLIININFNNYYHPGDKITKKHMVKSHNKGCPSIIYYVVDCII